MEKEPEEKTKSEIAYDTHVRDLARALSYHIARGKAMGEKGETVDFGFSQVQFNCRDGETNHVYHGTNQQLLSYVLSINGDWNGETRWFTQECAERRGYKFKNGMKIAGCGIVCGLGEQRNNNGPFFKGDPEADPDKYLDDVIEGEKGSDQLKKRVIVFNAALFKGIEPDFELERRLKKKSRLFQDEFDKEEVARLRFLTAALVVSGPAKVSFSPAVPDPYFNKNRNEIVIPNEVRFGGTDGSLSTVEAYRLMFSHLVHETAHSTSTPLNRKVDLNYGSPEYAQEELIAQLTSVTVSERMLGANIAGRNTKVDDFSAMYINTWAERVGDLDYFEHVVRESDKAGNHILASLRKNLKALDPEFHLAFESGNDMEKRIQNLADRFPASQDFKVPLQDLAQSVRDGIDDANAEKAAREASRQADREIGQDDGPDF